MVEVLTMHIATGENVADLATKVITNGTKQDYLVGKLLYDIYVNESTMHPCQRAVQGVKLLWVRLLIVSQLPFPSSQYCLEQYCTSYNTYIRFYLSFIYFV